MSRAIVVLKELRETIERKIMELKIEDVSHEFIEARVTADEFQSGSKFFDTIELLELKKEVNKLQKDIDQMLEELKDG